MMVIGLGVRGEGPRFRHLGEVFMFRHAGEGPRFRRSG